MKIVTLDVETTTTHKQNGAWTPSPFFENRLVSLGYKDITSVGVEYLCFYHSEQRPDLNGWDEVQRVEGGVGIRFCVEEEDEDERNNI